MRNCFYLRSTILTLLGRNSRAMEKSPYFSSSKPSDSDAMTRFVRKRRHVKPQYASENEIGNPSSEPNSALMAPANSLNEPNSALMASANLLSDPNLALTAPLNAPLAPPNATLPPVKDEKLKLNCDASFPLSSLVKLEPVDEDETNILTKIVENIKRDPGPDRPDPDRPDPHQRDPKTEPAGETGDELVKREVWEPRNWRDQLRGIREMRKNRDAPVDTMGCERCHDHDALPHVQRLG